MVLSQEKELSAMRASARRSGFAQLETVLVGSILTFIGVIFALQVAASRSNNLAERHGYNVMKIDSMAARFHRETGAWPSPDLHELVHEDYLRSGIPKNPYAPHELYRLDTETHRVANRAVQR